MSDELETEELLLGQPSIEASSETLPASTTPHKTISLIGLRSEEFATKVGRRISEYALELGRYLPLHGLDGITVAADYRSALADLDRGFEASRTLTPTEDLAVGVAMAPLVKRAEEIKTHIVIDANVAAAILSEDETEFRLGVYTLIHELAHCACHHEINKAFPRYLLTPIDLITNDPIQRVQFQMIDGAFGEYYACRASAFFNPEGYTAFDDVFAKALQQIPESIEKQKASYRIHGDIDQFFEAAKFEYGRLLTFAAYVMGHIDGQPDATLEDAPALRSALEGPFATALQKEWSALKAIWEQLGDSTDVIATHSPLLDSATEILNSAGIELVPHKNRGLYVNVPF